MKTISIQDGLHNELREIATEKLKSVKQVIKEQLQKVVIKEKLIKNNKNQDSHFTCPNCNYTMPISDMTLVGIGLSCLHCDSIYETEYVFKNAR